jgi:hypothetical protein
MATQAGRTFLADRNLARDHGWEHPGLASGNASRLAAMQRAEKIDELLEDLNGTFHHLRQSRIDEELFDIISGFDALSREEK